MVENVFDLKNKCDAISIVVFLIVIVTCNFNVDLKSAESKLFNNVNREKSSVDVNYFSKSYGRAIYNANKRVKYYYYLGNSILKTEFILHRESTINSPSQRKFQVSRTFKKNVEKGGRCKRAAIDRTSTDEPVTEGVGVLNYDDYTDDTTWIPPTLGFTTEYPMDKRHLSYILPKFSLPTTVDVETLDKMVYTGHEYEWTDIIEMIGTRKEPRTSPPLNSVERAWQTIVWSSEETTKYTGKTPELGTIWTPYDFNRLKARISSRSSLSDWYAKTSTLKATNTS